MDKKSEAYNLMSKKKYELEEKRNELEIAKDEYRETLVNETINNILTVLKEEETLTERDLKIFLRALSVSTKQIYNR